MSTRGSVFSSSSGFCVTSSCSCATAPRPTGSPRWPARWMVPAARPERAVPRDIHERPPICDRLALEPQVAGVLIHEDRRTAVVRETPIPDEHLGLRLAVGGDARQSGLPAGGEVDRHRNPKGPGSAMRAVTFGRKFLLMATTAPVSLLGSPPSPTAARRAGVGFQKLLRRPNFDRP